MEIIPLVKYEKYLISKRKLIKHALQNLNKYDFKILFVVNNLVEKKLIGTITDGDIRRALINGFKISDKVEKISFKDCFSIKKISQISEHAKKINEYAIKLVPIAVLILVNIPKYNNIGTINTSEPPPNIPPIKPDIEPINTNPKYGFIIYYHLF